MEQALVRRPSPTVTQCQQQAFYHSVQYGVKHQVSAREDLFDYEEIRRLAIEHKPKLMWVGGTAHPLVFITKKIAKLRMKLGLILRRDIAHVAGLSCGRGPILLPFRLCIL